MPQHPEYPNIPLKEMLCLYDLDQTYDLVLASSLSSWRTTGYGDFQTYKNSRFFDYLIHFWDYGTLIDYFTCDGAPFADQLSYLLYQFYLPFSGSTRSPFDNYSNIDISEIYQTLASTVNWDTWTALEVQLPAGTGKGTICYYLDETQANWELERLRYPAYCLNKRVIHYQLGSEPQTIRITFDDEAFPVIGTFVCGGDMADEVEASIPSIWLYSNLPTLLEWLDTRVRVHWDDREMIVGGYNWSFTYEIMTTGAFRYKSQTTEHFNIPRPTWHYFCWLITANNKFGQLVERGDIYSNPIYYEEWYGTITPITYDLDRKSQYLNYSTDRVFVDGGMEIHRNYKYISVMGIALPELGYEPSEITNWQAFTPATDALRASLLGDNTVSGVYGGGQAEYTVMSPYCQPGDDRPFYWYKELHNFPSIGYVYVYTDTRWIDRNNDGWDNEVLGYTARLTVVTGYLSTGSTTSYSNTGGEYTWDYNSNNQIIGYGVASTNTLSGTVTFTPPSNFLDYVREEQEARMGYTFDQFLATQDLSIMVDSQRIKEIHAALQADKFAWMPSDPNTLRNANLGYYIERIARVLGISVKPDGSIRTIRPKKFIKAGEVIPAGWYGGCFGSNTGGSLQGQPGGTPDEERDGIVYEIKSNLYDPENGTIEAGGYALCENWIQYLDAMADDLDKALGWQELGAVALPSADGSRQVVYEGLITTLVEALFNTSALSMNTTQTQATSLATHQMVRELLRGLGLPLKEKIMPVDVGDADSDGYIAYPGYDTNSPTLSTLLFAILQNQGLALGSQVKVPDPVVTTPQQ